VTARTPPMTREAIRMETLLNTVERGLYSTAIETIIGIRQFAVILAALLWSQYEFVANR
jgi:hypothetical protein